MRANIIYPFILFFFFNQDAKLKLVCEAANRDEYWLTLISLNLNTKFPRKTVNQD